MAKPVDSMENPCRLSRIPAPQNGAVPPAYPTRVRCALLAAFHGSYPISCHFHTQQYQYAFHHILLLSKIILGKDSSPLGLLIFGRLCLSVFVIWCLFLRGCTLLRSPLAMLFFKPSFTPLPCLLGWFFAFSNLFWLGLPPTVLSAWWSSLHRIWGRNKL